MEENNIEIVIETPIEKAASKKEKKKKTEVEKENDISASKKRGKKTKTSLIAITEKEKIQVIPNVIMHLKCSLSDLNQHNLQYNKICKDTLTYNPEIPPEIMSFSESTYENNNYTPPDELQKVNEEITTYLQNTASAYQSICYKCNEQINVLREMESHDKTGTNKEETRISSKIKELKISYYKNETTQKKSACFWCSYDFDNKAFFIPRNETNEKFVVYGSFCTPECAVAYLFKEKIDDASKFERFHLLNKMYASPENNIKPAPNPFYLLEKYLGNLTIQEYRRLLKTQHHSLVIVEKPMTRVLPELHSDNETGGNMYKIKRQSEVK